MAGSDGFQGIVHDLGQGRLRRNHFLAQGILEQRVADQQGQDRHDQDQGDDHTWTTHGACLFRLGYSRSATISARSRTATSPWPSDWAALFSITEQKGQAAPMACAPVATPSS